MTKVPWKLEFRATAALAWPMTLAQLASVLMVTVDMIMVGRLGKGPLAAVALGNSISYLFTFFGLFALSPINPLVARAVGAKTPEEIGHVVRHGLWVALLFAAPITLLLVNARWIIYAAGTLSIGSALGASADPALLEESSHYARTLAFGIPFFFLYIACQNALRGLGRVRVPLMIMLAANVVNLIGNWLLIYGKLGWPALGSEGSAWATTLARAAMVAAAIGYIQTHPELRRLIGLDRLFQLSRVRFARLVSLGVPLGVRASFDYAIYTAFAVLMSRIGAAQVAANQITFNLVLLVLMFPSGIANAASIRISRAIGAGRPDQARRALLAGFALAGAVIAVASLTLGDFPGFFLNLYTADDAVVVAGIWLVRLGALRAVFDACQGVALNGLVAMLDTRIPSLANLLSYWLLALPLGYWLAFRGGWGAPGLWAGLCAVDLLLAVFLVLRALNKLPRAALALAT